MLVVDIPSGYIMLQVFDYDDDDGDDNDDNDADDDDIYYDEVCVCLCVLKNHHFPLPSWAPEARSELHPSP